LKITIKNGDAKYKTHGWRGFRDMILARDKYTCKNCARKGIRQTANTVHHIEPNKFDEFYNPENVISLCAQCHNAMHNRDNRTLTDEGVKWVSIKRRNKIPKIKLNDEA
jgi:5-methylcytosine-specific restriction endonuclease McrA